MSARHVPIGKITGAFGVAGWVRVHSYTHPRGNILGYNPWHLGDAPSSPVLERARAHGASIVAKFRGVDDRGAATALAGREITLEEGQFEPLPSGEYYWFQLVGLEVVNLEGRVLGTVERLIETGANDVLAVRAGERERLVPYVAGECVKRVNLERGRIEVDWQVEEPP